MIALHPEGVVLSVRAQPNARKNAVLGVRGGALRVAVSAPPEDGRANEALVEVLRGWLGVRRSEVELVAGHTNRDKRFLIRGLTPESLAERIAAG